MLTSENIQNVLLLKRRMEQARFETKLNVLKKEEKKTISSYDHSKGLFVHSIKTKRKEWWKADNLFRERFKRANQLSSNSKEKFAQESNLINSSSSFNLNSSINLRQDLASKELANLNDMYLETNRKTSMIDLIKNDNIKEQLSWDKLDQGPNLSNITKKVSIVSLGSGKSNVNLTKNIAEPSLTGNPSRFSLPEIKKNKNEFDLNENSSKLSLRYSLDETKLNRMRNENLLKHEENKLEYLSTLDRFIKNTPFYIETKSHIDRLERERMNIMYEVNKGKEVSSRRDSRFDNLLNCLNKF